jgi:tetratricopeptide (TPR) repeat protein
MKKIVFLFSFALLVMSCMQTDATNKELTAIEYYNRGVVYVDLGKYQLALDDYSSAIRINPDYAKAYNNRGGVYVDLGKYQLALDDYSSAIRINPDDAKAYDNRGIVKWHLKLEYCNDFKRACDLGQCDNYNKGCK